MKKINVTSKENDVISVGVTKIKTNRRLTDKA